MNPGLNTTDDVFTDAPQADPVDDHVTEKEALKRAEKEGITFVDSFYLDSLESKVYATREEAEEANKKAGGKHNIVQKREQKQ